MSVFTARIRFVYKSEGCGTFWGVSAYWAPLLLVHVGRGADVWSHGVRVQGMCKDECFCVRVRVACKSRVVGHPGGVSAYQAPVILVHVGRGVDVRSHGVRIECVVKGVNKVWGRGCASKGEGSEQGWFVCRVACAG